MSRAEEQCKNPMSCTLLPYVDVWMDGWMEDAWYSYTWSWRCFRDGPVSYVCGFFFFFFLGEERKAGPSMRGSGGIVCELVDARVGRYFWGSNFLGC